jgi:hypothetical protein
MVVFDPFALWSRALLFSYGWLKNPPSDIRPQAFPLWLLAPRLLGAVLFPRTSSLLAGARAPLLFGERNVLSPASVSLLVGVTLLTRFS